MATLIALAAVEGHASESTTQVSPFDVGDADGPAAADEPCFDIWYDEAESTCNAVLCTEDYCGDVISTEMSGFDCGVIAATQQVLTEIPTCT